MIETEITDKVNALTEQDWSELQDLYKRVITHKGSFSEMGGGENLEDGSMTLPYTIDKPIIAEVQKYFLDKHLLVMFDWSHWSEGKAMFRVKDEDRFTDTNLVDTVKLFTAVMRNDRFCDGAWAALFENGDAVKLLQRLLRCRP